VRLPFTCPVFSLFTLSLFFASLILSPLFLSAYVPFPPPALAPTPFPKFVFFSIAHTCLSLGCAFDVTFANATQFLSVICLFVS
jgi:hypothetical protein